MAKTKKTPPPAVSTREVIPEFFHYRLGAELDRMDQYMAHLKADLFWRREFRRADIGAIDAYLKAADKFRYHMTNVFYRTYWPTRNKPYFVKLEDKP